MDDFTGMIQWIKDNGGYIHPQLERRTDTNGVSGIYTKVHMSPRELLVKVPNKLTITDKLHDSPANWSVRTKHAYSLIKELRKGKESFFAPMFPTVPELKEYQSHPFISLAGEEKAKLEAHCAIYRMFRESYEAAYREFEQSIRSYDLSCTNDEILRSYMLVVTRSWPGLYVPYMDLFNHSVQYGAVNQCTPMTQELHTSVDYPANSQIYISYGIKDVLSLAYDYGFYEDTDYSVVIPRRLTFIADNPIRFAAAKILLDRGLTGDMDVNKNLCCYYKDMSIFCRYDNFIGFSDHGISQDTWDTFSIMAISSPEELTVKKGNEKYTKELLIEHIQNMLTSVDPSVDVSDADDAKASYAYRMLIKASKKRTQILNECLEWLKH